MRKGTKPHRKKTSTQAQGTPLPDPLAYEMGNVFQFDTDKLLKTPNRKTQDEVIIALASAYNDLSGMVFLLSVLDNFQPPLPPAGQTNGRRGTLGGLRWQTIKYIFGILHEVLKLHEKKSSVFKQQAIQAAISELKPGYRSAYEEFFGIANVKGTKRGKGIQALRHLLERIRNDVAFHYYEPEKWSDYFKKTFARRDEFRDGRGFICMSESVQSSRFLFFDAVVEQFLIDKYGEVTSNYRQLTNQLFQIAHTAIYALIVQYFSHIKLDLKLIGPSDMNFPFSQKV